MGNKGLTLNEYQIRAKSTDLPHQPIVYPTLGLTGEAGEVADKVKKEIRDKESEFSEESRQKIAQELGDVLWYSAILAEDLGYTLEDIAVMNLTKISSRQLRKKIHGEGDER